MTDYISRQAAINKTYELREHFKCWDRYDDVEIRKGYADIPAADVVKVVRCKDCKYAKYDKYIDRYDCYFWSGGHDQYTEANEFCSYGEKRDD